MAGGPGRAVEVRRICPSSVAGSQPGELPLGGMWQCLKAVLTVTT